ncbi:lycopene cyclase domain-containing protein [Candidatus Micrarchaeota archaeon]|nr:lycopene cyclase domain-containing protein [Candidatus Micrarchaeota archaeon]
MAAEYAMYLAFVLAGTLGLKRVFGVYLGPAERLGKTLLFVAALFIAWDALAVWAGQWSFDTTFLIGPFIGNQPLEEIAFFFVVPLFYLTIWEVAKKITESRKPKMPKSGKSITVRSRRNGQSPSKRGGRRP